MAHFLHLRSALLLLSAAAIACGSNQTPVEAGASSGGAGGTSNADDAGVGAAAPGGPVALDGAYNARDTGGLVTASGKRVKRGVLIRSGHLADLSASGCAQLAALGVRSVIDLRSASDAASTPDATCATQSAGYYLADLPKILPPSADSYSQTLDAAEPKLAAIFDMLATGAGVPCVIHCVIGRDRASLVMALVLLSLGVPTDQVLDDFVHNQDAAVQVDAAWMQSVVDRIAAAGGIEAYLGQHGVALQSLEALRAAVLE